MDDMGFYVWDGVTQAKNLLTCLSFLSFHQEPPKVFFTLYNTKQVYKLIRYKFLRKQYPRDGAQLLRKLVNGHFHRVGLRGSSVATVPKFLQYITKKSTVAQQLLYTIYHVNRVFFLQANSAHKNKTSTNIDLPKNKSFIFLQPMRLRSLYINSCGATFSRQGQ